MKKTLFVLGAGNGCGTRVAEKFGKNDFRVVLMSRNPDHLAQYEQEFRDKGIEVYIRVVDAARPETVTKTFDELKQELGVPDVLFYNVGITTADADLEEPKDAEVLMKRYQVDVAGAYHAIQQVLGEEFSRKNGTILVTGGGFGLYPMDDFLPLSMDKAALRAMCIALHNKLKEENVYVGTLTVTDSIVPGTRCDPALLAEDFWKMYLERGECEWMH